MKYTFSTIIALCGCVVLLTSALDAYGQADQSTISPTGTPVTLDSCRQMALANNKKLRIGLQEIEKAEYQKKEARSAYYPALDFTGGYLYNQKKLSIFDKDQMLPTETFNPLTGKYEYNLVKNPLTGEPVVVDGQPVPTTVALIPKEAMEYDIHNLFFGTVTLTQPVFMGGKIKAMNAITGYAEELARELHSNDAEDLIYNVDANYWQVVSLKAKYKLANSYCELLDTLKHNVEAMINHGVATRSDLLTVEVKLNQANVDLTKVENGLTLSRMALSQMCGLPVNTVFPLVDEELETCATSIAAPDAYNMEDVYARRSDLQALETGIKIYEEQVNVARAEMLPNVALVGTYTFSNPNMFNGFKKRFNGQFSVGAMLTIPLWHWGGNYYKYNAAKTDVVIAQMKAENAREMIDLQVTQADFKVREALKTYQATTTNLAKANENLRSANLGFKEGIMTTDNVMEAQTAWLKANSENIDAMIDVQLCRVYLSKVLGTLVP